MSTKLKPSSTVEERAKQALKAAQKAKESGANWVEAHNALYGIGATFAQLFPTKADRTAFLKTPEHGEIAALLEELPEPEAAPAGMKSPSEVSGKIHVRLPRTIHAALLAEAKREGVSLNQLILSKLCLQLQSAV